MKTNRKREKKKISMMFLSLTRIVGNIMLLGVKPSGLTIGRELKNKSFKEKNRLKKKKG